MRAFFAGLMLAVVTACGGRTVEVQTGPKQAPQASVQVTNNLTQAVNVYVTAGGSDIFLKQVAPNASEAVPVQGVAPGTAVVLKATTVDGTRTYTKENVTLASGLVWQVP
jgi:hypothetical protein